MVDPGQFDRMINWAFVSTNTCSARRLMESLQAISTLIYGVIGYAGYLMFGYYVSDEVSVIAYCLQLEF
jgi:vesicular inhibitory amino acid transporter